MLTAESRHGKEDAIFDPGLISSVVIVVDIRGGKFLLFQSSQRQGLDAALAYSRLHSKQPTGICYLTSLPSSTMSHSFCDENQGTIGLAFTWILLSFGILTVSLRIYVRSGVNGKIGWDDYTAVASLVSTPSYLRFAFTSVVARFPTLETA